MSIAFYRPFAFLSPDLSINLRVHFSFRETDGGWEIEEILSHKTRSVTLFKLHDLGFELVTASLWLAWTALIFWRFSRAGFVSPDPAARIANVSPRLKYPNILVVTAGCHESRGRFNPPAGLYDMIHMKCNEATNHIDALEAGILLRFAYKYYDQVTMTKLSSSKHMTRLVTILGISGVISRSLSRLDISGGKASVLFFHA
jgi:hypothetical protein